MALVHAKPNAQACEASHNRRVGDAINAWLNPHLGDMQLADVGNAALRKLVAAMLEKLSAKSIVNYIGVAKSIVASAVDNEGEQLFPRAWNHEFMGLPIVNKKAQ